MQFQLELQYGATFKMRRIFIKGGLLWIHLKVAVETRCLEAAQDRAIVRAEADI